MSATNEIGTIADQRRGISGAIAASVVRIMRLRGVYKDLKIETPYVMLTVETPGRFEVCLMGDTPQLVILVRNGIVHWVRDAETMELALNYLRQLVVLDELADV